MVNRPLNLQFLVDFGFSAPGGGQPGFDGIISINDGIRNIDNMVNAKY